MTSDFNIIDNISPKPAMFVRVEHPKNFKSKGHEDKHWDEEFRRWREGYSGLTGIHYFYLMECLIPDANGAAIRPYWRDCDSMFFEAWVSCGTKGDVHDLMCIKRREIGLSTWGGGVIPIYNALTKAGSDSVITSASKSRLQAMFRKKTEFIYDELNPYYKEDKARKSQSGQLFIAKEDKVNKTFSGLKSQISSIDTVKDPYGFESYRASYMFLDEAFLHPKIATVKSSANSSRMQGLTRMNPILLGGTCGLMDHAGAQEGLKIYKSSKETKTDVLFLGGTKGIEQFSVNGHCDEKAAEEWILKTREEYSKAEDKTEYFKFLTSYPLSIEEVFNLVSDCALPQEVQITLNNSERKAENEGYGKVMYKMESNGASIRAVPDPLKEWGKGGINIIKEPIRGHRYIAGTDPIPFGNNALGEGSKYSIIIFDYDTREFVADYTERNLDDLAVVNRSILLQKLYYRAPTMLELNRGEVVFKDYLGLGEQALLAPMPTHLGIVWEDRKYPFGYVMGGGAGNQVNARCEALVLKFLIQYGSNIRHKQLIGEARKLSTESNTDLLDAAKAALLYAAELDAIAKISTFNPVPYQTVEWRREANGALVRRLVTSDLIR